METGLKDPKFLKFDKARLFSFSFFGILLFLLYQLLKVLSPFISAIIVAGTLALIFYPIHLWIRKKVNDNNNAASVISTAGTLLTVVLPMLIFGWLLFKESKEIYPKTSQWLSNISQTGFALALPPQLKDVWNIDAGDIILRNLKNIQENIMKSGGRILTNIFFFLVNFMVMIVTIFVFFRDGERLLHWIIDTIPMDREHKYRIANQLYITTIAVVRGILLTAVIQGVTAMLGYAIAGLPAPVLLGCITSFAALVPFVGTSVVWIPLGLFFMFYKGFYTGLFVLLWGLLVIGLLDNILRPVLIGKKAKLPIFLLFLGIFGGLKVYGPIGIFLGPLLISCVIVFLQIYREAKNLQQKQEQ
ncbi:MAG: AI-2E family transporter [Elusimicrobia bacterium]|nr:AI-2E family transporter [Elusimicrobiota bacterium]